MTVAQVVLDIPTRALSAPFSYSVPESLRERAAVGVPVVVDFSGRPAVGWIVTLDAPADTVAASDLKELGDVIGTPLFDSVSARLALHIATEYCAPPIDALSLFIPPGAAPRMVRSSHGSTDASWNLRQPSVSAVAERLIRLEPRSSYVPRSNATLQRAILDACREGPVTISELTADLGPISSAVRRLESEGAISVLERRRYRATETRAKPAPRPDHLSDGQVEALEAVLTAPAGSAVLLDGITGSGKTEVYLQAIEALIAKGRGAIVLVPEISLTPQTVGRFRTRFGDLVGVLHSRLGAGERRDEWDRLAAGDARVAVGARSALFAPIKDLGVIVIDEEHSASYKQGSAPRYDARMVAHELAKARGAVVVLASATPSLETRIAADSGGVRRVVLPERVGGGALPEVTIVDMGEEFTRGNRSIFSETLTTSLAATYERGDRAILLLNRRGFASFLLCRECGHVPTCESCSTSLTYHETGTPRLACHHCGATKPVPATCPQCDSPYLRQFGAGTQRVEGELRTILPDAAVLRMDADTTTGKGGHERVLAEFEATPGGILIGTQMVAKGLDYPDVTLVGVLNADTTLHLPDFRSAERTYQLLAQVAGRAGRGTSPGQAIIQTYWPEHPALRAVASHDAAAFYETERRDREELRYPPFARLANILVAGEDLAGVKSVAQAVATALQESSGGGTDVLGPSPAPLARLKRQHRWHVVVRSSPDSNLPDLVCAALSSVPTTRGVRVAPDIDPSDML